MKSYDLVVVGCGILGASTAYHLKRRGVQRVLLLERGSPAAGGTGKTKDLKANAVTGPKIAKRAVGSQKLKQGAVSEVNLQDGAVSAQKLAPSLASGTASFAAAAFVPVEDSTHNNMGSSVYCTPVVANGTLFIANRNQLFAISEK